MTGAASCGEKKYFYLVSLLGTWLIKYDFSSASQWLLGEQNLFPGGIQQDRSIYFRHRWRWSKSGLGECPIWNYPILTVIGISPFFKFQSQRERQFQSPAGSAFGNSIGDDRVGGAEHCFRISQRKNVDGKTLGYFHHFVPFCCKLRLGHMTTFLC